MKTPFTKRSLALLVSSSALTAVLLITATACPTPQFGADGPEYRRRRWALAWPVIGSKSWAESRTHTRSQRDTERPCPERESAIA